MAVETYKAVFEGKLYEKTYTEWEMVSGISSQILRRRAKDPNTTKDNFLDPVMSKEQILTIDGHSLTVSEWGDKYGISGRVIKRRLQKGWEPQKAVSKPVRGSGSGLKPQKLYSYNGKRCSIKELAELSGLPERIVRDRLVKLKWSVEKTVNTPQKHKSTEETRKKRREWIEKTYKKRLKVNVRGTEMTISQYQREIGDIPSKLLYSRLRKDRCRSWTMEQILETENMGANRKKNGISDEQ